MTLLPRDPMALYRCPRRASPAATRIPRVAPHARPAPGKPGRYTHTRRYTSAPSVLCLLSSVFCLLSSILPLSAHAEESLAERRQRVAAMTTAQREQLQRRQEQFAALPPAEQTRVRDLHAQLEHDPEEGQLRQVMQHYCDWLKTLPPYRRHELLELEPAERIKRIKKLLQEQTPKALKGLNDQDAAALARWLERYAAANEGRLLKSFPEARQRQLMELGPSMRHRVIAYCVAQRWQEGGPGKLPLTDKELADLRAQLSPTSRQWLHSRPPADQWKIIHKWLRAVLVERWASRHLDDPLPPDQETELAEFFEHKLTDAQRDRLLGMPGEEMQRELRRMYLKEFDLPESPRGGGGGKRASGNLPRAPRVKSGATKSAPPAAGPAKPATSPAPGKTPPPKAVPPKKSESDRPAPVGKSGAS